MRLRSERKGSKWVKWSGMANGGGGRSCSYEDGSDERGGWGEIEVEAETVAAEMKTKTNMMKTDETKEEDERWTMVSARLRNDRWSFQGAMNAILKFVVFFNFKIILIVYYI